MFNKNAKLNKELKDPWSKIHDYLHDFERKYIDFGSDCFNRTEYRKILKEMTARRDPEKPYVPSKLMKRYRKAALKFGVMLRKFVREHC